jgi:peptidoglycan L-alanyl-D-glutamate endopeptidase CwlK
VALSVVGRRLTMLNTRSLAALKGVHSDLARVVKRAAELAPGSFIVTEGLRTVERQRELFARGLSKTMNSRHLTGHAIDFAPLIDGQVTWKTPAFLPVISAFKQAAADMKVPIVSGGDWRTFKDYPHIELDRKAYP